MKIRLVNGHQPLQVVGYTADGNEILEPLIIEVKVSTPVDDVVDGTCEDIDEPTG